MPHMQPRLVLGWLLVAYLLAACQRITPPNQAAEAATQAAVAELAGAAEVAPDFTLPTPDGQALTLSSLRGKYVLVDFWASWCGPCRAESPNLRKIYGQFHGRGLEIVSVSLDVDGRKWRRAIQDDSLTWHHVSDLRGWESKGARAYAITAIPYNVLLDPQGRVLARNLHGRALGQKISAYIPLD
mgnify:CR=1 FL=1